MSKEVKRYMASLDGGFVEVVDSRDYDALLAERDGLRDALEVAVTSMMDSGYSPASAVIRKASAALKGEQP